MAGLRRKAMAGATTVRAAAGDPRTRSAAALLVRFVAAEVLVRYVERVFFVKWLLLGAGVVAAALGVLVSGWWWVLAVPSLVIAGVLFVVAWLVTRFVKRWSVPKRFRNARLEVGDIRDIGWQSARSELGRAGLPTSLFGLLGLVRGLSGRSRREVSAELWDAVQRVELRRVLPTTELATAAQRLLG